MSDTQKHTKPNVPNLRFPGFSGEWELKRIDEISPLQRGFDLPSHSLQVGSVPVVYSNGIINHHNESKCVAPGIVTGRSGTIGRLTYIESGPYWPHNTSLWVTDFKGNIPLFVYYLLEHIDLSKFSSGSGVPTLNRNDVHAFKTGIPSKEEQHKIAECLSIIDKRISIQNKVIEKYESLIKALTDKVVDEHLKGRMVPFNQMYIQAGEGGTPSTSVEQYYLKGTIPFIKIDDLSTKYLVGNKVYITELGLGKSSAWLIPSNSVIYSNGATIGAISINTYPVSTKQGILGIVPAAGINTEYLYYLMSSRYFSEQVQRIITEGTMKTAYLKDMNKIPCPLPSSKEQQKIVAGLSALSIRLESEQKALLSYESIKKYLIRNLFI